VKNNCLMDVVGGKVKAVLRYISHCPLCAASAEKAIGGQAAGWLPRVVGGLLRCGRRDVSGGGRLVTLSKIDRQPGKACPLFALTCARGG
jgi:hypothetical protein